MICVSATEGICIHPLATLQEVAEVSEGEAPAEDGGEGGGEEAAAAEEGEGSGDGDGADSEAAAAEDGGSGEVSLVFPLMEYTITM